MVVKIKIAVRQPDGSTIAQLVDAMLPRRASKLELRRRDRRIARRTVYLQQRTW